MKIIVCAALLALAGCAGPIQHWIVDTRVHQGDVALGRGSLHEAATAYRLALRLAPNDQRATADGVWKLEDDNKLAFYSGSNLNPDQVLEIVSANKDRLIVKK